LDVDIRFHLNVHESNLTKFMSFMNLVPLHIEIIDDIQSKENRNEGTAYMLSVARAE